MDRTQDILDRLDRIIGLLEDLAEIEYTPDWRAAERKRKAWEALPLDEKYRQSVEVLRTVELTPVDPDRPKAVKR